MHNTVLYILCDTDNCIVIYCVRKLFVSDICTSCLHPSIHPSVYLFLSYNRSAGLVAHPSFIDRTKWFQHAFSLDKQIHLRALSYLPSTVSQLFMSSMSHWSKGQNYTGIDLNLYKAPGGLMLSSFEAYNAGLCGYQQMPWVANIAGVGLWSGSGNMSKLSMFDIANLFGPHVSQKRKILVAAYVS